MNNNSDLKSRKNIISEQLSRSAQLSDTLPLDKSLILKLVYEIFKESYDQKNVHEIAVNIVNTIKSVTSISAVGLRLKNGNDFNIVASAGFSPDFIDAENSLLCCHDNGTCPDTDANSVKLCCMCGLVISGNTVPGEGITSYGSFWTSDSVDFAARNNLADYTDNVRGRCLDEGYKSIALIPVRSGDETIGLLILNDRRTDFFNLEVVELFEELAKSIAVALDMHTRTNRIISDYNNSKELLSKLSDFMVSLDIYGNILAVSSDISEYFDFTIDEVKGKNVYSIDLFDIGRDVWSRIMDDAVQTGVGFEREVISKNLAGGIVFMMKILPQYEGRELNSLTLIFNDITEYTNNELIHIAHESFLKTALDSSREGIIVINTLSDTLTYVNKHARRFRHNFTHNHVVADTLEQFFSGIEVSDLKGNLFDISNAAFNVRIERGGKVCKHLQLKNESGETAIINFCFTPEDNLEDNAGVGVIVFIDISDIITLKSQRDDLQERFTALFNLLPDTLVISRFTDGKILEVNAKCYDMFGISRAEAVGNTIESLGVCVNSELMRDFFEPVKDGKVIDNITVKLKRKNNELFDANIYAQGIYYAGVFCILSVVRDVSEVLNLSDKLKQSEKMSAIGQLVGGVAHDFNNQLTGILGYSDFLVSNLDDPDLKGYAQNIATCAVRSADLTEKLLAFSRKSEFKKVPIDVHSVLLEVINMLEHSIDKKITIGKKFNAVPSTTTGDPSQLQNALLNLGINARDAISDDIGMISFITENIKIDSTYYDFKGFSVEPGNYICIKVRDTGTGMNAEIISKIFEPFFTTKGEGKGTGMGLAAVWDTVKQHKGFINVNSRIGSGTTFELVLPEIPDNNIVRKIEKKAHGKGRILLVDDEEIVRILGGQMLNDLGYKVVTSNNGYEGVTLFEKEHDDIDLIILDMIMPKMSGREAFLNMKRIDPEVKIIITTGYASGNEVREVLKMGALGVMKKPFYLEDLSSLIGKVLES